MIRRKPTRGGGDLSKVVAEAARLRANRGQGYREQALKLFPHVCGRCGRDFAGKNLRELTVHHKDNDHMNNPPDGSNWELLCVYCHEYEHQTDDVRAGAHTGRSSAPDGPTLGYRAFEGLKNLLPPADDETKT